MGNDGRGRLHEQQRLTWQFLSAFFGVCLVVRADCHDFPTGTGGRIFPWGFFDFFPEERVPECRAPA
jgi:hypothetical protein